MASEDGLGSSLRNVQKNNIGRYGSTNRIAKCFYCKAIVPKGCLKFMRATLIFYRPDMRFFREVSYCIPCSKKMLKEERKGCKDYLKYSEKIMKSLKKGEIGLANKMMKDQKLIEAI